MATVAAPGARNTVYARNLQERIKPTTMAEYLRELFSDYGNVLDVVAKSNLRAKGQAFIVFEDPTEAAKAIEELNGFELFEKPLHLQYARSTSDAIVKATNGGTENSDTFQKHKQQRLQDKERKNQEREDQQRQKEKLKRSAPSDASGQRPAKAAATGKNAKGPGAGGVVPDEYLPPNKTLFVQNLPEDADTDALSQIFSRFEGYREVRIVPGRRGLAFVEYLSEQHSAVAKERTAGMALGAEQRPIKVTFQRQ